MSFIDRNRQIQYPWASFFREKRIKAQPISNLYLKNGVKPKGKETIRNRQLSLSCPFSYCLFSVTPVTNQAVLKQNTKKLWPLTPFSPLLFVFFLLLPIANLSSAILSLLLLFLLKQTTLGPLRKQMLFLFSAEEKANPPKTENDSPPYFLPASLAEEKKLKQSPSFFLGFGYL